MTRPKPSDPQLVYCDLHPLDVQALKLWAFEYAIQYSQYVNAELIKQRDTAKDEHSRLVYPDTTGG